MCELRFSDNDVLRVTSHVDAATVCTVTVPLLCPSLGQGALPCKFPIAQATSQVTQLPEKTLTQV